jgi:hypothetical protein
VSVIGPESWPRSIFAGAAGGSGAYRFVLTDGRFVAADGFTIDDHGTIARPDGQQTPVDGVFTATLSSTDCPDIAHRSSIIGHRPTS